MQQAQGPAEQQERASPSRGREGGTGARGSSPAPSSSSRAAGTSQDEGAAVDSTPTTPTLLRSAGCRLPSGSAPAPASRRPMHMESREIDFVPLRDDEVDAEEVIDEANEDVVPIILPPPLPTVLAEMHLAARPAKVYETLFKRNSAFRTRIYNIEGAQNVRTSRWHEDPELALSTCFPGAKTRVITCMRPMRTPLPGALKFGQFQDCQSLLAKGPGGFVLETSTTINAAGTWADFATIRLQWACTATGPHSARVRTSLKVDIKHDTAAFIEGTIFNTVLYHNKQRLKIWVDALYSELGAAAAPSSSAPAPTGHLPPKPPALLTMLAARWLLRTGNAAAAAAAAVGAAVKPRAVLYGAAGAAAAYMAYSVLALSRSLGSLAAALTPVPEGGGSLAMGG